MSSYDTILRTAKFWVRYYCEIEGGLPEPKRESTDEVYIQINSPVTVMSVTDARELGRALLEAADKAQAAIDLPYTEACQRERGR